jgi:hypothetical protein
MTDNRIIELLIEFEDKVFDELKIDGSLREDADLIDARIRYLKELKWIARWEKMQHESSL